VGVTGSSPVSPTSNTPGQSLNSGPSRFRYPNLAARITVPGRSPEPGTEVTPPQQTTLRATEEMIVRSQRHQFRPASTGVAVHQHQDEPHLPERLLQPQDRPQELHRAAHLQPSLMLTTAHSNATRRGRWA